MLKKVFLFLIIAIISLQVVSASGITTTFPETITLVDTPVSVDLYIHNSTNSTQTFNLTSFTAPYPSVFSENTIVVPANSSKKVSLKITPLTGQLESTYNSSIEVRSTTLYKKINFQIIQRANRTCPIDLQYFVEYVKDSENYKLELTFKNSSNREEEIEIIGLKDINLEQPIGRITISKKDEQSITRYLNTDSKETKLEYRCKGVYGTLNIELPEKDIEVQEEPKSIFTGLFTLPSINLLSILDSTIFQIILLIILIILVLSFTTRYIRYVFKK